MPKVVASGGELAASMNAQRVKGAGCPRVDRAQSGAEG